jgi:hypothetical protein
VEKLFRPDDNDSSVFDQIIPEIRELIVLRQLQNVGFRHLTSNNHNQAPFVIITHRVNKLSGI